MVGFLIKFTYLEDLMEEPEQPDLSRELQASILTWLLYVDRSFNRQRSGTRVILTTRDGIQIECAPRFIFEASNNDAKYEALLAGLQLATSMGAKRVWVFSDS